MKTHQGQGTLMIGSQRAHGILNKPLAVQTFVSGQLNSVGCKDLNTSNLGVELPQQAHC